MDRQLMEFPVEVYSLSDKYNDVLTKGRCRTFYKYLNRNGTYITDEFAEKLLSTLPYTPVKGIYDGYCGDYEDHGRRRDEGRIYGIVPENYNLAWEEHLDEDGVMRTYACVDVLLFTAIYEEASQIIGKSQSMELYPPSIKGDWKDIDGKRAYFYDDACFLGLQVLGEDIEPCFEGASFFSLYESLQEIVKKLENVGSTFQKEQNNTGGQEEMKFSYKLENNETYCLMMDLLNPGYDESGEIGCVICDINDQYALIKNHETQSYERAFYGKKDEQSESTEILNREQCYVLDITESEKEALDKIHSLTEGNFSQVEETYSKVAILEEQVAEFEEKNYEQKITEFENDISTLTSERDTYKGQVETLTSELEELRQYKAKTEEKEKTEIINQYSDKLDEEIIAEYTSELDKYSIIDLKKELAFKLVESTPDIFSKKIDDTGFVLKDEGHLSGIEAILSKYKNKN
jgi:hypothetical protein